MDEGSKTAAAGKAAATEEEGMDLAQLRRILQMGFPEKAELRIDEFMNVEGLLTLACEVDGEEASADRANVLLSNYALLRPAKFGPNEHLMQSARRVIFHLSSAMTWRRHLALYLGKEFDDLRFFDVVDGRIIVRGKPFGGVDRRPLYRDMLRAPARRGKGATVASPGGTYRYYHSPEGDAAGGQERQVAIPDKLPASSSCSPRRKHKEPRQRITVSLDEMIAVAKEVCPASGKAYYIEVLERARDGGLLKAVGESNADAVGELAIDRVCSLVGLVGSGKSVLANILIVALTRRGYKVASLLNSVSDVMECVAFLRAAGVSASPLVSRNERLRRLGEIFSQGNSMLLDKDVARYLETPCIIDGLSYGEQEARSYSNAPCYSLLAGRGTPHVCPYWDVCPSQAMAREAVSSDAVITTPSGFAMMTAGKEKTPFFEHVLAGFDLVIFDEADRVQVQLDSGFAPEMSFQELIYHSADPIAAAMKRRPATKMQDLNEESFYDLRQSCEPVAKSLLKSARTREISGWSVVKKEAFTSLTLLNDLKEQGLPEGIANDLENRVGRIKDENPLLDQAIALSCQGVDEDTFMFALDSYLEVEKARLSEDLKVRLAFLLKVIRFDEYLQELATMSDFLSFKDESMTDLYNFLRFSYVRQQRYLPSSLIGNMFGMRMTEDNDLILFRQFAFGRAFMNSLPWLDTDAGGNPVGPHVLLLSGSSYEPGCLQYHINRPVNYLLEAQPWVSKKLEETVVEDLGIEQNVSGSAMQHRSKNLSIVLSQLAATLCAELDAQGAGKALVIVNSYREAEDARERLESIFRSRGRADKVCALVRSPRENTDQFVPRSEVHRFSSHPARVLVAPALAIERGYNIVDDLGHAAFSTLVFAVRPMGAPHDIGARYRRLNGLVESAVDGYPEGAAAFARGLRADAWKTWKVLEKCELMPPRVWRAAGKDALAEDAIATLMVTVIQIFGRLARLKDPDRMAPHVYFADAAFRGAEDKSVASFRTLTELGRYLEKLTNESEQPAVAKALYGPFYAAFKKGVGR